MPFVSIITPVYKAEETIERCVESVLSQSFSDWELILVDDGSPDNSGALCDAYAIASTHIRVIHQENQGVSAARNAGIESATGSYLLFLDGDDYLQTDMLSTYADAVKRHGVDILIGGMQVIGAETKKTPPVLGEFGTSIFETICLDSEMFGYVGGKMIRTNIVKQHNIRFRTDMESQEDLEFFLSAYGLCRRFLLTDYAGYQYDYQPGKRVPAVWNFISNQMKLLSISRRLTVLSSKAHKAVEERIVRLLYACLYDAVKNGTYDQAWDNLLGVSGLRTYIHTLEGKGELYKVAKWFADEKYRRIRRHLGWRIRIKRLIGRG